MKFDLTVVTGVVTALVAGTGWLAHKAWPFVRKVVGFFNDVVGEPDRPGFEGRPGLMERMLRQENILADKVTAISDLASEVYRLRADQGDLSVAVAEIRKEVTTNGGSSLKDEVGKLRDRLAEALGQIPAQRTPDIERPPNQTTP